MPLLGSQVEGGDSLHRLRVCRSPVLQQAAGHLHLVLLGSDVQGGVPILQRETERLVAVLSPCQADQQGQKVPPCLSRPGLPFLVASKTQGGTLTPQPSP